VTTAREMVTQAARTAKIIASSQELSAEDAADGLKRFNQMLHAWSIDGLLSGHTDLVLTDDVALPDGFEKGARLMLAIELADEFGGRVSELTVMEAERQRRNIQNQVIKPREASVDPALRRMSANNRSFR
jgi:hypothetical protein